MRHPEGSSGASPSRPPMASSASGGAQGNKKREPPALELNLDSHVGGISVNLKGLHFVKPETIAPELCLRDCARAVCPSGVRTVRDLLLAVESTQRRLHSLNLFSKTASELHCGQKDGEVCVTLHLKEERRRCNVGVNISGRGETELEASASIPALGGTNKSLTLTAATAPMGGPSRVFSASLFAPRLPGFIQRGAPLFSVGTVRLFSSRKDMTHYNSTALTATGTAAELRAEDGTHAVTASFSLRDSSPISAASRVASPSVMLLPWRSFKHSFRYVYTRDELDKPDAAAAADAAPVLLPRKGYRLQAAAEAALPGGDARFLKGEIHGFAAVPLTSSRSKSHSQTHNSSANTTPWILTGRFGLGALLTPKSAPPLCLDDKFHFAGASSALRGFKPCGVGPADQAYVIDKDRSVCTPVNDHLGGDAFFASEVCLAYDFHATYGSISTSSSEGNPSSSSDSGKRGFGGYHPRVFVFGSVGGIANVFQHHTQLTQKDAKTVSSRMSSLFRDWRGTVGLGICFPLQRGVWLEGALALPVRRAATDETERLHIGLRVTSIEVPS
ncbi:SAM50-like protein SPAC17C9.06 [Cyclospora cayetanensis]|uniref:SAM50-like protein SPAC17C9.06 n=1 Tax=Cyclospora cayetanensis TaxID=88456 RepID=A0A6P6S0F4_9EIME|nr:SAM50-like protein SPAC17C9.06 [Cyclospora cayetanensis]